jgi:nitroreductase
MVRSFDATPVDPEWLRELCVDAMWAPTAGNTAGVRMHVAGPELVGSYFEVATDEQWRTEAPRANALMRAGGVVLVTSRPSDYLARYAQPDKAGSGLDDHSAWSIPYWHTDAAMATMALLLLLDEAGWAATLWGNFRREREVLEWAHASDEALFATVLVGRDDGGDRRSASLDREVATRAQRVRRVEP